MLQPVGTIFQEFLKRWRGWRVERVMDEFGWNSPKGTLPCPEGTNGKDYPCQPLLVCPQPCPGPHFSPADLHLQAEIPAWTQTCPQGGAQCPGLGGASAAPQLPWSLLRRWDGLQLARPFPVTPVEP